MTKLQLLKRIFIILCLAILELASCKRRQNYVAHKIRYTLSRKERYQSYVAELRYHTTPWVERYSPNYGYEPYWKGGDWILQEYKFAWNLWETGVPTVCGVECGHIYRTIGAVCAMKPYDLTNARTSGCWFAWNPRYCSGRYVDGHPFVTFSTYCKFMNAKCSNKAYPGMSNYIFVHIGPCLPLVTPAHAKQIGLFHYLDSRGVMRRPPSLDRVTAWITQLYSRWSYDIKMTTPYLPFDNGTTVVTYFTRKSSTTKGRWLPKGIGAGIGAGGKSIIETGKDILQKGQEVYQKGKEVVEKGKKIVQTGKNIYEKGQTLYKWGKRFWWMSKWMGKASWMFGESFFG